MLYYVTKFLNLLTDNCIYYRRSISRRYLMAPISWTNLKYLHWPSFDFVFVEGKTKQEIKNRKQEATAFRELRCEESKLQSRLKFFDVQKYSCCFLLSFKNTLIDIYWYSPWVGNQKINWSIWSTDSGSKSLQWCQHISTTS